MQPPTTDPDASAPAPSGLKYGMVAFLLIGLASVASRYVAAIVFGVSPQYLENSSRFTGWLGTVGWAGGLISMVGFYRFKARCTNWANFRRKIGVWVAVASVLAGATLVYWASLTGYLTDEARPTPASAPSQAKSSTPASEDLATESGDKLRERQDRRSVFDARFSVYYTLFFSDSPDQQVMDGAFDLALTICDRLDQGDSLETLKGSMAETISTEWQSKYATAVLNSSIYGACPEYQYELNEP